MALESLVESLQKIGWNKEQSSARAANLSRGLGKGAGAHFSCVSKFQGGKAGYDLALGIGGSDEDGFFYDFFTVQYWVPQRFLAVGASRQINLLSLDDNTETSSDHKVYFESLGFSVNRVEELNEGYSEIKKEEYKISFAGLEIILDVDANEKEIVVSSQITSPLANSPVYLYRETIDYPSFEDLGEVDSIDPNITPEISAEIIRQLNYCVAYISEFFLELPLESSLGLLATGYTH